MFSSKHLVPFLFILVHFVCLTMSQGDPIHSCDYSSTSKYRENLRTLLSSLSSSDPVGNGYGFYNVSTGENEDKVNAIALCRGDFSFHDCRSCVNDSSHQILQLCPTEREAIVWLDVCMLRYSNRSIFSSMETYPVFTFTNPYNVSDLDQFNQKFGGLLNTLQKQAASGGSFLKFASGNVSYGSSQNKTIYALVQCTPDISEDECLSCLETARKEIPGCCGGKEGGRIYFPSCYLQFESRLFYSSVPITHPNGAPSVPTDDTTTQDSPAPLAPPVFAGSNSRTKTIVLVVFAVCISMILIIIPISIYMKKRKQKGKVENIDAGIKLDSLQYDFCTLELATNHFSDANKLGQGGFGTVYKGQLPNGQEIAVKRLSRNSGQGEEEFKNEILLLARLQHRNLVKLLGFCLEGLERLLIYEFMPNASLNHFIVDSAKRESLDWERRYKIIRGIAQGLLYLHEELPLCIVHRDLKASNILLDSQMNPKISDFGMARLFKMDQTKGRTSTIVGTYGYMAPEYVHHGNFSLKSDVYSFGVLVLEIVCGQQNSDFHVGDNTEILSSYVWKRWVEDTAIDFVDPTLTDAPENEMVRCIHIGLLCAQENVVDRPTMASVVQILNSNPITLPVPSRPAFFINNSSSEMESSSTFHSLLN